MDAQQQHDRSRAKKLNLAGSRQRLEALLKSKECHTQRLVRSPRIGSKGESHAYPSASGRNGEAVRFLEAQHSNHLF